MNDNYGLLSTIIYIVLVIIASLVTEEKWRKKLKKSFARSDNTTKVSISKDNCILICRIVGLFVAICVSVYFGSTAIGSTRFKFIISLIWFIYGLAMMFLLCVCIEIAFFMAPLLLELELKWLRLVLLIWIEWLYLLIMILFAPGHKTLWLYHTVAALVICCIIYKLTKITFRTIGLALDKGLHYSRVIVFKLVICIVFMQILTFSFFMQHVLAVSYSTNQYFDDYAFFEFQNDSGTSDKEAARKDDGALSSDEFVEIYEKSLYYVITTYTSVGYGDITPSSSISKLFSNIVAIYGYFMSAVIIGILISGAVTNIANEKIKMNQSSEKQK